MDKAFRQMKGFLLQYGVFKLVLISFQIGRTIQKSPRGPGALRCFFKCEMKETFKQIFLTWKLFRNKEEFSALAFGLVVHVRKLLLLLAK